MFQEKPPKYILLHHCLHVQQTEVGGEPWVLHKVVALVSQESFTSCSKGCSMQYATLNQQTELI